MLRACAGVGVSLFSLFSLAVAKRTSVNKCIYLIHMLVNWTDVRRPRYVRGGKKSLRSAHSETREFLLSQRQSFLRVLFETLFRLNLYFADAPAPVLVTTVAIMCHVRAVSTPWCALVQDNRGCHHKEAGCPALACERSH